MQQTASAKQDGSALTFEGVRALLKGEMRAVNALIQSRLASNVALIDQVAKHLIDSGGKRLRPMLVLLSAIANRYPGKDHIQAAAIIEFIHTATLLHDDVVDESDLRRGRQTANAVWGNAPSVLVGDFLYSRAFQLMVELDDMRVMRLLADTTNAIAEGEVMQLMFQRNPETSEADYLAIIGRKTAVLFAAAARLGAMLAHAGQDVENALSTYGYELGLAFQIADDVLDYQSNDETLGKRIGADLAEGKLTLPLIKLLALGDATDAEKLGRAIRQGDADLFPQLIARLQETHALARCHEAAARHAANAVQAIAVMPASAGADALRFLADFSTNRAY